MSDANDDRRAERNAVLAREVGWILEEDPTSRTVKAEWILEDENGNLEAYRQHTPPDMHTLPALAEVLRGMTDLELEQVEERMSIRSDMPQTFVGIVLYQKEVVNALAAAIVAVIEARDGREE